MEGGRELPADMVFISSSEAGGVGYIETANLDGENSLKVRQALSQTVSLKTDKAVEKLWRDGGWIVCDMPNKDIHKFTGYLEMPNGEKIPISNANILYRGARLKNTDYVYGITIYTGNDTKLKMNNTQRTLKRSKLARMTNSVMLAQFGVVIILSWAAAVMQRGFPNQQFTYFTLRENVSNFSESTLVYAIFPFRVTGFQLSWLSFAVYGSRTDISLCFSRGDPGSAGTLHPR